MFVAALKLVNSFYSHEKARKAAKRLGFSFVVQTRLRLRGVESVSLICGFNRERIEICCLITGHISHFSKGISGSQF
jgi:hypothetical protein